MKRRLIHRAMIFLTLLLPACQPFDIPAQKIFSTETPTAAPSSTPSSSPTQKPAQTVTVEYTPTPTPISMPNLRVVFYTPDGIWRVDPPASQVMIKANYYIPYDLSDIRLSDDGKVFVYLRGGIDGVHVEIFALNDDGGNHRLLLSLSQTNTLEDIMEDQIISADEQSVKWIPQTHHILFTTKACSASGQLSGSHNNLFSIDVDTGAISRMFQRGVGGIAYPSPDGKKMIIENYESVFLASHSGDFLFQNIISFTTYPCRVFRCIHSGYKFYRNGTATWSADSSRFGMIVPTVLLSEDSRQDEADPATIFSVDASAGIPETVGIIEQYKHGVLSPTLEYVGYTIPGEENNDKYSYDATISLVDGTSPILLAGGISHFHSFSPDGRYFSFSTGCTVNHYSRKQPPIYSCPTDVPEELFYVGSLDGELFQVPGEIQWINNSQFVYATNGSLRVGDVGGNWIEIAKAEEIIIFDAKDLDFQAVSII